MTRRFTKMKLKGLLNICKRFKSKKYKLKLNTDIVFYLSDQTGHRPEPPCARSAVDDEAGSHGAAGNRT